MSGGWGGVKPKHMECERGGGGSGKFALINYYYNMMMKFRRFPSKKRRFLIHSRMRGEGGPWGIKANRMNCERGGGGSGKFVLIKHDDEISSISVE